MVAVARVLVLAEDHMECELLASMLRVRGHDCECVASAGEAMAKARASSFDLAVIDLDDARGVQRWLRVARRLEWTYDLPALFLSIAPESLRPGFVGCGALQKPFRSGALAAGVEAALAMVREGRAPESALEGLRLWPLASGRRR